MDYLATNPDNGIFVAEIRRRADFNNLGQNLPNGFYREMFKKFKTDVYRPLWDSIDEFIAEQGFDVNKYWRAFDEGDHNRQQSQQSLCPMYVYLRRKGFDEEFITS